MEKIELAREVRKQRRLEKLKTDHPRCGTCGERDDRSLELHHVVDYGRDCATVIICRNCHRKVSDDQRDHPPFDPSADVLLDRIGHFLLGLADLLRIIIERLYAFGTALIARGASHEGAAS